MRYLAALILVIAIHGCSQSPGGFEAVQPYIVSINDFDWQAGGTILESTQIDNCSSCARLLPFNRNMVPVSGNLLGFSVDTAIWSSGLRVCYMDISLSGPDTVRRMEWLYMYAKPTTPLFRSFDYTTCIVNLVEIDSSAILPVKLEIKRSLDTVFVFSGSFNTGAWDVLQVSSIDTLIILPP